MCMMLCRYMRSCLKTTARQSPSMLESAGLVTSTRPRIRGNRCCFNFGMKSCRRVNISFQQSIQCCLHLDSRVAQVFCNKQAYVFRRVLGQANMMMSLRGLGNLFGLWLLAPKISGAYSTDARLTTLYLRYLPYKLSSIGSGVSSLRSAVF
jgi:hypothetical protein